MQSSGGEVGRFSSMSTNGDMIAVCRHGHRMAKPIIIIHTIIGNVTSNLNPGRVRARGVIKYSHLTAERVISIKVPWGADNDTTSIRRHGHRPTNFIRHSHAIDIIANLTPSRVERATQVVTWILKNSYMTTVYAISIVHGSANSHTALFGGHDNGVAKPNQTKPRSRSFSPLRYCRPVPMNHSLAGIYAQYLCYLLH
jgi:hypothetical protein